jgi:hypothetical protein
VAAAARTETTGVTTGYDGTRSRSRNEHSDHLAPLHKLQQLPQGEAVLLYENLPPARIRLLPGTATAVALSSALMIADGRVGYGPIHVSQNRPSDLRKRVRKGVGRRWCSAGLAEPPAGYFCRPLEVSALSHKTVRAPLDEVMVTPAESDEQESDWKRPGGLSFA